MPATALAQATPPTGVAVVFLPPTGDDDGSFAGGISADGTVAAGYSDSGVVRWVNGAPQLVEDGIYYTLAVSGDGKTIVGYTPVTGFRPFVWTQAGGTRVLEDTPQPGETLSRAAAVDTVGKYVAINGRNFLPIGSGQVGGVNELVGYRWSATGGYQSLGQFGAPPTVPVGTTTTWGIATAGISGDGSIIVGSALDGTNNTGIDLRGQSAFRWTEATGLQRLPFLVTTPAMSDNYAEANGISRDGSTIVGGAKDASGLLQAVYWRNGAVTGLGFVPGLVGVRTVARGASADGSVIVGDNQFASGGVAWRWTAPTGMQDLNEVVRNAGLDLNGFRLRDALGVSDNGQFIIGSADNDTTDQGLAYILQLAQITQSRLIVTIRLPGVTLQSVVNQTFATRVDGTLNGATLFTRNFTDPITSATGVTALADAKSALQSVAGLRRVVIGDPVLVATTTTVSGRTSTTQDVLTGTQITTAAVNTLGPATVATGDRGVCATPAASGQNPTGCSLPGTPVSVDTGILNSNVYTNTINSVTPTTTTSVNQLITAQWRVAAIAGNQFGTVHALVGRAGFDRGDRWLTRALAASIPGSEEAGDGARAGAAVSGASRLAGGGRVRVFGEYFGDWQRLSADPVAGIARARGRTNGANMGILYDAGGGLNLGIMADYGKTSMDVRDPVAPESLDADLVEIGGLAGWQRGRLSLSAAAAAGFGKVRTVIAAPGGASVASRRARSWSLGASARVAVIDGKMVDIGASAGVRYAAVDLHRFTETGGATPLAGLATTVSRTRLFAGLDLKGTDAARLKPWAYARAAYDSGERAGVASVVFAGNPGLGTFRAVGPDAGRWSAEVGAGLDARLSGRVQLNLGYQGSFRRGENAQTVRAGVTMAF